MALILGSNVIDTIFTAPGDFEIQSSGTVKLQSRINNTMPWVDVVQTTGAIRNPNSTTEYRFIRVGDLAGPEFGAAIDAGVGPGPAANVAVTNFPAATALTDAQLRATAVPISGTVAVSNFPTTPPNQAVQLLTSVATTGPGTVFPGVTPCTFSAQGTTTSGTGTAVINIEVRLGTAWELLETITLTLSTTGDVASFPNPSGMYTGVRANVRTITGTGAEVDVFMGY